MSVHRWLRDTHPYAVDFRPGSTVTTSVEVETEAEGEIVVSQVKSVSGNEVQTTTLVWPKDVLAEFVNSLDCPGLADLPGLARWLRDNDTT